MSDTVKIEISREDYNFLTKLAVLMKTQNIKGTSFPLYCIYDKQQDETIKFINCFLTEKAMNEHLFVWAEEFNAPFTHIRSANYTEEMKQIMKFIVSLDELVLEEHSNKGYGI